VEHVYLTVGSLLTQQCRIYFTHCQMFSYIDRSFSWW